MTLTKRHFALYLATLVIYVVFSSSALTVFDETTTRPHETKFDPRLRQVAKATNFVVKSGMFHVFLYSLEFLLDPELFKRHVGQRMTTLWFQLIQPVRHGQHLSMQLETLFQVADAAGTPWCERNAFYKLALGVIVAAMCTQNALTSYAYHSFNEQTMGFVYGTLKMMFDYSPAGLALNTRLGENLDHFLKWLGGILTFGGVYYLNDFAALHPTFVATSLFVGGLLATFALRVRGGETMTTTTTSSSAAKIATAAAVAGIAGRDRRDG